MDFSNKKITRLVLLLSKKERKRAQAYLKSPYFIGPEYQKILSKLFRLLVEQLSKKKLLEIDDHQICELVFGEDHVVPGKIDKFLSMLHKELINMLGLEAIQQTKQIDIAAAAKLRKAGEYKLWNIQYKKIETALKRSMGLTPEFAIDTFKLAQEKYYFYGLEPRKTTKDTYLDMFDALEDLYIDEMLQKAIQILSTNSFIFPIELGTKFEMLKSLLVENKDRKKSARQLVNERAFDVLSNLATITEAKIDAFLALLSKHKSKLRKSEYNFLRYVARSLVIHLYNHNVMAMQPIILKMYKEDFEDGSIYYNGKLPASTLNNITIFATRENQIDWIKKVLEEQEGNILEPGIGDFIIRLNRAKVHFHQKQFQLALDTISLEAKDFYQKINARILELMCHYELRSEQLDFKIEAYKLFIYRIPQGKVAEHYRNGHNQFIDVLKSIYHPSTALDTTRLQRVKSKVEGTIVLAEKKWLLESIDALIAASKRRSL